MSQISPPPSGYPSTFLLGGDQRPDIFDPALKHYGRAFRPGEPVFADGGDRRRWYEARASVIDHVLRTVAASPWRARLLLRGSVLLHAFIGEKARTPGDIDWVVLPAHLKSDDAQADTMLEELTARVLAEPIAGPARLHAEPIGRDEIWTYERADGIRLSFVWSVEGLPAGTIQLDFVFGEKLPQEPVVTAVPAASGEPIYLLGASAELSLAWKILWLETDSYPQGKDLYDAVMLAEHTVLSMDLLRQVLDMNKDWISQGRVFGMSSVMEWQIDWKNFQREYPWVQGDLESWRQRLIQSVIVTRSA
ncbi:nucleotidyl transferase AbiEii/AbiGii toxin family protein [Lysobacter capsici]|uniref:nucleotidyl transferase AbiEii/AbiGii toxin family protein n=1 Tax=Lysobacter capsici TaxID=435897 RepID=UPI001C00886A|nr:nucleotidyl transferase AbiEii/AbiGii toxin family protein [Lysobacter capsici]QWF18958.1 nucleotidyl transferase AbiEii/AbiGii toxin family protein [Lysobacter capsici]